MSLFLYKPHVEGPEGNVTTPDIVIDRVFVGSTPTPLTVLTTELYHQAEPGGQSSFDVCAHRIGRRRAHIAGGAVGVREHRSGA